MSLKHVIVLLALSSSLGACGPDTVVVDSDWAIGSFSGSKFEEVPKFDLFRIEISDDGMRRIHNHLLRHSFAS